LFYLPCPESILLQHDALYCAFSSRTLTRQSQRSRYFHLTRHARIVFWNHNPAYFVQKASDCFPVESGNTGYLFCCQFLQPHAYYHYVLLTVELQVYEIAGRRKPGFYHLEELLDALGWDACTNGPLLCVNVRGLVGSTQSQLVCISSLNISMIKFSSVSRLSSLSGRSKTYATRSCPRAVAVFPSKMLSNCETSLIAPSEA